MSTTNCFPNYPTQTLSMHHLLPPKTSTHCPYSLRKRQHTSSWIYTQYKNKCTNRRPLEFRRLHACYDDTSTLTRRWLLLRLTDYITIIFCISAVSPFAAFSIFFVITCLNVLTTHVTMYVCNAELNKKNYSLTYKTRKANRDEYDNNQEQSADLRRHMCYRNDVTYLLIYLYGTERTAEVHSGRIAELPCCTAAHCVAQETTPRGRLFYQPISSIQRTTRTAPCAIIWTPDPQTLWRV